MYTEHDCEPLMAVVAMDSRPGYHKVDEIQKPPNPGMHSARLPFGGGLPPYNPHGGGS